MSNLNKPVLVQGDREIFPEDIDHIRTTLRQFSSLSRSEVIDTLCEHLNWLTPAGLPKTTACTKLLNRLEEQDIVRLPAKRKRSSHPGLCAQSAPRETGLTGEQAPLEMSLTGQRHLFWPV